MGREKPPRAMYFGEGVYISPAGEKWVIGIRRIEGWASFTKLHELQEAVWRLPIKLNILEPGSISDASITFADIETVEAVVKELQKALDHARLRDHEWYEWPPKLEDILRRGLVRHRPDYLIPYPLPTAPNSP